LSDGGTNSNQQQIRYSTPLLWTSHNPFLFSLTFARGGGRRRRGRNNPHLTLIFLLWPHFKLRFSFSAELPSHLPHTVNTTILFSASSLILSPPSLHANSLRHNFSRAFPFPSLSKSLPNPIPPPPILFFLQMKPLRIRRLSSKARDPILQSERNRAGVRKRRRGRRLRRSSRERERAPKRLSPSSWTGCRFGNRSVVWLG